MFEKREYRTYHGIGKDRLYRPACDFWARQGFFVTQSHPDRIEGESNDSFLGLKRRITMMMYESPEGTHFDLKIEAKVTDWGIVGGILGLIIAWPLALIVGLYSYHKYNTAAKDHDGDFWEYMNVISNIPSGQYSQESQMPVPGANGYGTF